VHQQSVDRVGSSQPRPDGRCDITLDFVHLGATDSVAALAALLEPAIWLLQLCAWMMDKLLRDDAAVQVTGICVASATGSAKMELI